MIEQGSETAVARQPIGLRQCIVQGGGVHPEHGHSQQLPPGSPHGREKGDGGNAAHFGLRQKDIGNDGLAKQCLLHEAPGAQVLADELVFGTNQHRARRVQHRDATDAGVGRWPYAHHAPSARQKAPCIRRWGLQQIQDVRNQRQAIHGALIAEIEGIDTPDQLIAPGREQTCGIPKLLLVRVADADPGGDTQRQH